MNWIVGDTAPFSCNKLCLSALATEMMWNVVLRVGNLKSAWSDVVAPGWMRTILLALRLSLGKMDKISGHTMICSRAGQLARENVANRVNFVTCHTQVQSGFEVVVAP